MTADCGAVVMNCLDSEAINQAPCSLEINNVCEGNRTSGHVAEIHRQGNRVSSSVVRLYVSHGFREALT